MASSLTLISSMATRQLLAHLVAQYQRAHDQAISIESVGGVEAAKRVSAGEAVDIVVLAANAIDQLIESGHVVTGSRVDLVNSGVAVAVRQGSSPVDIASEESVKAAILAARNLSYSTGPSGVHLSKLFERWGIADSIASKIVQAPPGVPVGSLVANAEVDLGFQQLSELMNLPGITVLGPLPAAIQIVTTFSGAVSSTSKQADAARAFLDFAASPQTAEIKRGNGMDPA